MKTSTAWVQKYLGTNKPTNCLKTKVIQDLATDILRSSIDSQDSFYEYINNLYHHGTTFEEMVLAATIFTKGTKYRSRFDPTVLNDWLSFTVGWAEVDTLCQSSLTTDELLFRWKIWEKTLLALSSDHNIHKRRASLVLLCKPLRLSTDQRILDLAINLVEKLKTEKEILITKAISWVLRSMVKNHSSELKIYLDTNKDNLPRIAYRESIKKLTTGKKS